MSRGKYSPWCYHNKQSDTSYEFNCYGEVPVEWNKEHYGEKTMFDNYDRAGFDSYGYSAFYLDGRYAGVGSGIDRYGYTENEYLCMTADEFESVSAYATELTEFNRIRDTCLTQNETLVSTTKGHEMNLEEVNVAFDAQQVVQPKKKRKTAAEKRVEEQARMHEQQEKDWELFKAEYPEKFAALMYDFFKFQNSGTQTSVNRVDDGYEFSWISWTRQTAILQATPPEKYSWDYEDAFNDAIQAIQDQRDKEAEANRILIAKNAALAKLTAEEKKLLGL